MLSTRLLSTTSCSVRTVVSCGRFVVGSGGGGHHHHHHPFRHHESNSVRHSTSSTVHNDHLERMIPKHLLRNPKQSLSEQGEETLIKINSSIVAYLENAAKHTKFIADKKNEFELGKRHLANIMGWDPDTITQTDINKAIEYLFPSGLFEKLARPRMLPPEEIYPKFKEAQYGLDGRPYNSFFYTGKPNYFQTLYELYENYQKLDTFQDQMMIKNVLIAPKEARLDILDYDWLNEEEISKLLLEKLKPNEYQHLITNLNVLIGHPYSARCKDFILKFTKRKVAVSSQIEIPPLTYNEQGIPYAQATGKRKTISALVTVYGNGSGKFTLNGEHNLQFFEERTHREQIFTALKCADMLTKVDIDVKSQDLHAKSALAGAIRHGISQALRSFVETETIEKMRLCGLLTKDRRIKERKKPGLYKARKRHPWKAR